MESLDGHRQVERRTRGRRRGDGASLLSPGPRSAGKKNSPTCNIDDKADDHPAVEGGDTSSDDNQTGTEWRMSLKDRVSLIHCLI
jgi:hypothetical protein